jgi:hypothetical protein
MSKLGNFLDTPAVGGVTARAAFGVAAIVAAAVTMGVAMGVLAPAAFAHHSGAMFDNTKSVTLLGTIVEVRWTNPHVTIMIEGKVEGADTENAMWLLEMSSPSNLLRVSNWSRTTVKPGDRVKVVIAPLRDSDQRGGNLKTLTLIDTGQSFTPNIREREEPGLE